MTRPVDKRLRALQIALAVFAITAAGHLFYYSLGFEGGLTLFAQQLLNALTMGGIYALIAVGYTMVYGIIQLINFAHGEIYMMGAFLGITFIGMGVPFLPAMAMAMAGCALMGMAIDQIAYRPLRRAPRLAAFITAIGMSLFLQNLAMMIWGASVYPFPDLRPEYTISITAPGWTPDQLRDITLAPFERYMAQVQRRDFAGVPFLKAFETTKQSYDDAREALQAESDPEARARRMLEVRTMRRRFKEVLNAIPVIKSWQISPIEHTAGAARAAIRIRFRIGTKENDAFGLLNDWRGWARTQRPEGLDRSHRLEIGFDKATHVFQKDALTLLGLVREAGIAENGEDGARPAAASMGSDSSSARTLRVQIPVKVIFILAASIVLMVFLNSIVQYTKIGKAMRACAQDKATAALMGVNVNRVIVLTFMLGSAMAAVAGILYGLYLGSGIYFRMGYFAGVLAFAAAVLGGIGNLKGAMLGGLLLGFVQGISKAYITEWLSDLLAGLGRWLGVPERWPQWTGPLSSVYNVNASYDYALAFTILILVILIRPTGLLGKPPADRA
ncbi:MAG: hypothetical protein Kow0059_19920 [Candidatus Sumerlaeia bacterium]